MEEEELHPVLLSERDKKDLISFIPEPFFAHSQELADRYCELAAKLGGSLR